MELLGLIYGVCGVLALLVGLSAVRAGVEYRSVGMHRGRLLRRSIAVLALSLVWSLAAVGLLLLSPWSHGAPFSVSLEHTVLALLPVTVGWFPGLVLLALGAGDTEGTRTEVPPWARWMDALWTE